MQRGWSIEAADTTDDRRLMLRFCQAALSFWSQRFAWRVWALTLLLLLILAAQLWTQYLLSYWNRDFFNALENKNSALLLHQTIVLLLLS